jgi:predicted Holliday junction resolvase-like endonuclease
MISFNNILNRLDVVFYIIVFAVIYVAIIYLWKKIAQLESSFYKLETTFATQLLYKNKENTANQFAEDMFMKVFDNKQESPIIEIIEKKPDSSTVKNPLFQKIIKEEDFETSKTLDSADAILSEVSDILTPSTDENYFTKSKLSKMSVDQLKEHCGNFGFSTEGTKPELINKLLAHHQK